MKMTETAMAMAVSDEETCNDKDSNVNNHDGNDDKNDKKKTIDKSQQDFEENAVSEGEHALKSTRNQQNLLMHDEPGKNATKGT